MGETFGLAPTLELVRNILDQPLALSYSNVDLVSQGVVE
jgi:hypothetical protein